MSQVWAACGKHLWDFFFPNSEHQSQQIIITGGAREDFKQWMDLGGNSIYNVCVCVWVCVYVCACTCMPKKWQWVFTEEIGRTSLWDIEKWVLAHLSTFLFYQSVSGRWYLLLLTSDTWFYAWNVRFRLYYKVRDVHKDFSFHLLLFLPLIPYRHPQILLVTLPSFFKLKTELVFDGLDVMGRKKKLCGNCFSLYKDARYIGMER